LFLDASETHHLRRTIRLGPGDSCLITDGRGWEAEASVREFCRDGTAILDIVVITKKTEPEPNKVLFRVMPVLLQRGKNDLLMEKAQELGVDELWPLASDRCEIKIPAEKIAKTVDRWQKVAIEASKQSGCLTMVRISEPQGLKDAIQKLSNEDALAVFHPGAGSLPFSKWVEAFHDVSGKVSSLNVLIGPEGGLTDDEIEWVRWRKKKNLWIVGLGEVVFKADTVFIGVLASLRFSGILSI